MAESTAEPGALRVHPPGVPGRIRRGLVLVVAMVAAGAVLLGCGSGTNEVTTDPAGATATTTTLGNVCVASAIATCVPVTTTSTPATDPSTPDTTTDPAAAGPDGCGLELDQCGSGANPSPSETGLAECTTESFHEAVVANIDGGSFTIVDPQCDGTWAAFTVDRSRDACPASDEPQPGCRPGTRAHRTFWHDAFGHWVVITYGGTGDCAEVQAVEPDFPTAICS